MLMPEVAKASEICGERILSKMGLYKTSIQNDLREIACEETNKCSLLSKFLLPCPLTLEEIQTLKDIETYPGSE